MKTFRLTLALLATILFMAMTSCNKDKDPGNNGGDDNNQDTAKATVVVNELMTKDHNGLVYIDGQGDACDWVELYNGSDKDADIAGYYLTDKGKDAADDDLWQIPASKGTATIVKAKSYLVIVFGAADAAGNDMEGIINDTIFCPKGLSTSKDKAVALFDDNKKLVDESEDFTANGPLGELDADKSLGREGDGADTWKIYDTPTPGAKNQ